MSFAEATVLRSRGTVPSVENLKLADIFRVKHADI